jgi:hypothetical protein
MLGICKYSALEQGFMLLAIIGGEHYTILMKIVAPKC